MLRKKSFLIAVFLPLVFSPSVSFSQESTEKEKLIFNSAPIPSVEVQRAISSTPVRHQLIFAGIPGTPARMTASLDEKAESSKLRVVLNIDGQLLVVKMRYLPDTRLFIATFPTPRHYITYRFQLFSPKGTLSLTPAYRAEMSCGYGEKITAETNDLSLTERKMQIILWHEEQIKAYDSVLRKLIKFKER